MTATGQAVVQMRKHFVTFGIDESDLARLAACQPFAEQKLPQLLADWNTRFGDWPEIQSALMNPAVHPLRVAHWVRAASGRFDDGFQESARRLAAAFYDNGVPAYAVAICHSTVVNGICNHLGLNKPESRLSILGKSDKAALRATLHKVAWFDLEILLETYATAETESKRRTLSGLADAFEERVLGIVENVAISSRQMDAVVDTLSETAARSTKISASVAASAEEAASGVANVAESAGQLGLAISEISGQVLQSRNIAVDAAERSKNTTATIGVLAKAVEKIGAVVSLISNIAGQTNLLALNATIESARAGEAGRGFAVVASEVKALAGQTAKATDEIAGQIANMQNITAESVQAIDRIGEIIQRINDTGIAISAAVEEQSVTTNEIARSTQEVSAGNRQVSELIVSVKNDAESTADIARRVTSASRNLGQQAQVLQVAVEGFLKEIRAA